MYWVDGVEERVGDVRKRRRGRRKRKRERGKRGGGDVWVYMCGLI